MLDLTKFGTPNNPLRASRLNNFLTCPWREVMLVMELATDSAGLAADTGSAVHAAVSTWHETGEDAAAAIEAMRARSAEYPLADMAVAASLFLTYTTDPANRGVDLALNEAEVVFDFQAPHGPPITIMGHVDQVRRVNGVLEVWDLKTSSKPAYDVLISTTIQAAAYCLGASIKLGMEVHPGGIIMPKRTPMHIPFTWTIHDVSRILQPIIHLTMLVRQGIVWHKPDADTCRYCHTGGPDVCLPRLRYELPVIK